ncbi:MAG: GNAT family N-acetyltransferase [Candidatus Methanosuratincola sp.]
MQIVRNLDEQVWRDFVGKHPQGNIFHTPEMFAVYQLAAGHDPGLWAAVEDGSEVLALMLPVEITLLNGPARSFTSRAVAYGSALTAPGTRGQAALGHLLHSYNREMRNRLLFTELRNLSDLKESHPILNDHGFEFEDHLNFLIDLNRSPSQIWNGIRPNARRNIKKARNSHVRIEEVQDPAEIVLAYKVLKNVYHRIQVPLPDISLFQTAFDTLAPRGMMKVLCAKLQDVTIGVLTLLFYKEIIYYWYTGTLKEYSAYRPGDLLVWHSLEMGNQLGFKVFDFGGGGRPNEKYGVRDFKAKFGGELVNFGRNVRVHSPLRLKISQAGYQLVRRFF